MLFESIVIIVLIILVVHQFNLWTKFKNWLNHRTDGDSPLNKSHNVKLNAYGLIVIVGVVFGLIIAYFQVRNEVDINATNLALQSIIANPDAVFSDTILANQVEFYQGSFNFGALYFNQFIENAALYILLPILISLGTVFMQEEMKKNKEQLTNIKIGKDGVEDDFSEPETVVDVELEDL